MQSAPVKATANEVDGRDHGPQELVRRAIIITELDPMTEPPGKVLDRLYQMLSVLDTKASSLLGLNALAFAVIAFIFQAPLAADTQWAPLIKVMAVGGLAAIAISSGLCFSIVRIRWPFLTQVSSSTLSTGLPKAYLDEDAPTWSGRERAQATWEAASGELLKLASEIMDREKKYERAWKVSLAGCVPCVFALLWFIAFR